MIRSAWVYLVGAIATPLWASYAILSSFFARSGVKCRCTASARRWSRWIMRASGSTVTLHGLSNYDPDEPRILIANHQSWFDVFALCGWLPGDFRFVAKKELARIPLFGASWQRCGHISIDRSDLGSAIESLQTAADRIARDKLTIAVFPEGTRSDDGRLQPFKKGAFVLAIRAGVPIVPVAILGTRDIMAKGRWKISGGRVQVHVGKPLETSGFDLEGRDELRDASFRALSDLMAEASAAGHSGDAAAIAPVPATER